MSKDQENPPVYQSVDPSGPSYGQPPPQIMTQAPPTMVYAAYQSPYAPGVMYNQQMPTVTVIQQPIPMLINQRLMFGRFPQVIICPNCQAQVTTIVDYESGAGTWLFCFLLCILGLNLGCQFIPFCVDSCKDAIHICPNCSRIVGRREVL